MERPTTPNDLKRSEKEIGTKLDKQKTYLNMIKNQNI